MSNNFFSTQKKGENYELRMDLNSEYQHIRKEAVKKVIANMTIGKDVSSLFPDVVKNMQTDDIKLKKLVYLYLINYAKSEPELVILAVNTFVKDCDHPTPLIRALAIRTMGCLQVEKILDYLMEPLKKALRDDDPYVRKTAALCVAKIFDHSPAVAIENGLITYLQEMLTDRNPMVIANVVTALMDISQSAVHKDVFVLNSSVLAKLLAALNECTEWGQIGILSCLSTYRPVDNREAVDVIERVIPRLQHVNASLVLAALKVLMVFLPYITDQELTKTVIKKMAPPLVTLVATVPEIQYVALRNINLILQKQPTALTQEIRVFFTKYDDPPYVKAEKLEIIIKLASPDNIDQVLSELKEYANEVDVGFVRKSVSAIGRCAVKVDGAADRCVNVLLDLIKTQVNYVVQEAIIVMRDIFRKYPHQYEGIISALCQNLDVLDEPEAKASLIWIIGEYADRIENAEELLEYFSESITAESSTVQIQLMTACVKLFLQKPGSAQQLVHQILQNATQANENPDIRDRAYVYWRLLSSNPQIAKAVVLAEKPPIQLDTNTVSETLLDELIYNIGSLASVYHKPTILLGSTQGPSTAGAGIDGGFEADDEMQLSSESINQIKAASAGNVDLLSLDFDAPAASPAAGIASTPLGSQRPAPAKGGIDDLLGLMDLGPETGAAPPMGPLGFGNPIAGLGGLNSLVSGAQVSKDGYAFPYTTLLAASAAQGLQLEGTFWRRNCVPFLGLKITNLGSVPMSDFAIQFNVNSLGITPSAPLIVPNPVPPGQTFEASIPLSNAGQAQPMDPFNLIQIAIKNNVGVFYFAVTVPVHVLFVEDQGQASTSFGQVWNDFTAASSQFRLNGINFNLAELTNRLQVNNVHVVGTPDLTGTIKTIAKVFNNGEFIAAELLVQGNSVAVNVKSKSGDLAKLLQPSLTGILS
ncbi:adaptin N terminal region-domain-containing protein [Polychytrium aggregatum]|uniref:adaptin N terminal region-domain-containing protein n=1 Tax=Polychytrium aggregatum TaxID=110093 RepID=UPI0022FE9D55|nr:adaptin N terminal region-domain-containing protein [Polychytrium aggregatum]KAI9199270.1 adaptin N terminal region-domain-containing protein [Polychytrium aggregatum]